MYLDDYLNRTMLVERATGVLSYCIIVIVTYIRIKKSTSAKQLSHILNICTLALGILAYFYIPAQQADLYRWLKISENWKALPFYDFAKKYLSNNSTPLAYLIMYFCAQTRYSGLLPAICALTFYHNSFLILKDIQMPSDINDYKENVSTSFFLFMASGAFLEVISGVRCFVAFSFIARSFYFEIYRKRSIVKSIPFYIIAALIHNAVIPIIGIRLLYFAFQRFENNRKRLINLIAAFFLVIIALSVGYTYIGYAFNKANNYIFGDSYSYFWEYIIGVLQWLIIIYINSTIKKQKNDSLQIRNVISINSLFLAVEALLFFEYNIFHRMMLLSSLLCLPNVVELQKQNKNNNEVITNILTSSWIVLLLACARGNLCGFKFFLLHT